MTEHAASLQLFTLGHSNRSLDDFVELLTIYGVETLVDIRSRPGSRKHPHFNHDNLQAILPKRGLGYLWMPRLGGLRGSMKGFASPNTGLQDLGFRNYADYMGTAEFRLGVEALLEVMKQAATACMCAEAHYSHCHRMLLSDYLVAAGVTVLHILGPGELVQHRLSSSAKILPEGGLVYPPGERQESLFGEPAE